MSEEAAAVELLVDAHAQVGEGPFWHAAEQVLYWVDIEGSLVFRYYFFCYRLQPIIFCGGKWWARRALVLLVD